MKIRRIQGMLAAAVLGASLWSGMPVHAAEGIWSETKLELNAGSPSSTAGVGVSDSYAVWINQNDDNHAVILYDLAAEKSTSIAADGHSKVGLKVDGNYIAWIDEERGSEAVYLYDIDRKKTKRISGDNARPGRELDLKGGYVVWTDGRGSGTDIYAYDINEGVEMRISNSNYASYPAVDGSYVVWEDERNGNSDIYGYNLSTGKEEALVVKDGYQSHPTIDRGVVAYDDNRRGRTNIYYYDIASGKETKVTDDTQDREYPKISGNRIVYLEGSDLISYGISTKRTEHIDRGVQSNTNFSLSGNNLLFGLGYRDDVQLYLHNFRNGDTLNLGGSINDPSQPAGSDKYVVFINHKDKRTDEVVLYDVESKQSKVISSNQSPERPLVSNSWVVWYDYGSDALTAYNIKSGSQKRVTGQRDYPSREFYALEGSKLVWVSESGSGGTIYLTDLATGSQKEIDYARNLTSLDTNGSYITWLTDDYSGSSINIYDMKTYESYSVRRQAQAKDAHIGDDYIVWTEEGPYDWDLYYYSLSSERFWPVFGSRAGDQLRPQISRNMMVFEEALPRDPSHFDFIFYDVDRGSYGEGLRYNAQPSELSLGGNRIVWIDKRSGSPEVYTMAFDWPRDDGDDDGNNGEMKEYTLKTLFETDQLTSTLVKNDAEKVQFIFNKGSSQEKTYYVSQIIDNLKDVMDLINSTPFDKIFIRVYP
ncbi:hypothetical protein [Brevibacillus massiliensis]|uniref:hypothetical protein n=1 Tax=Brevibacillus massiliensis TaxID=1118054 RepID=UPI00030507C6|nr:hypothetical protein [Brevibacillus massiliensis]